jgi:hypothetical protein
MREYDSPEYCPICDEKDCQKHLLACFEASGEEGEYGVGLVGGPLYYEYEIDDVLHRARLAWVQSVRATGKPKAPRWIMNERGLKDYFDHLGGIDLAKYESDDEAADFLPADTDFEWKHAREDFLWEVLSKFGYLRRTENELTRPFMTTGYLSWWTFKPKDAIKKFRARLRSILLEAGVKLTKRKSWATREKEKLERLSEGVGRLLAEKTRDTPRASKPPTRTASSAGAERTGHTRESKRKSAPAMR